LAQQVIAPIEGQRDSVFDPARIIPSDFPRGGAVVFHTAFLRWQFARRSAKALSTYAPTLATTSSSQRQKKQLTARACMAP
jgi:phospholipase/carboxylesterase